jgi:hypothetical protein
LTSFFNRLQPIMFKELKVLKLVIGLSVLVMILYTVNYQKFNGIVVFPASVSLKEGEDVTVAFASYAKNTVNQQIKLTTWKGELITEKKLHSTCSPQSIIDVYRNGPEAYDEQVILAKAPANLYLLNDSIPVVVTSTEAADITVVFPQTGQLLVQRFFGLNAIDSIDKPIWINRPLALDEKTKELLNWLKLNFNRQ